MNAFQKRLQQALSLQNMKQTDFVEKTGYGKSKISQYVNGVYQPKPDALFTIAKALDVSEGWLMGEDVPMERAEQLVPTVTDEEYEILEMFRLLEKSERKLVKAYFEFIISRKVEKKMKKALLAITVLLLLLFLCACTAPVQPSESNNITANTNVPADSHDPCG